MTPVEINNLQADLLLNPLNELAIEKLSAGIVDFCALQDRTYWDLVEKFDLVDGCVPHAVWQALRRGQLIRRQAPDGWYFRAAFPGVDIDRIHHRRQEGATHAHGAKG